MSSNGRGGGQVAAGARGAPPSASRPFVAGNGVNAQKQKGVVGRRANSPSAAAQSKPFAEFANSALLKFHPPSTLQRAKHVTPSEQQQDTAEEDDERRQFLASKPGADKHRQAKLARQESLVSEPEQAERGRECHWASALLCCNCCCSCFGPAGARAKQADQDDEQKMRRRCLWLWPVPLLLLCALAVFCAPFVEFEPRAPQWPPASIPFDFERGPLRASSASQFRVEHLFRGQIHGAESMALDSQANAYLAIEGGLILYAHLNASAPVKTHYLGARVTQQPTLPGSSAPKLIKIAELNSVRHLARPAPARNQRSEQQLQYLESGATWRRECQHDEQLYGSPPYSAPDWSDGAEQQPQQFVSHVRVSRCSKPLGTRLSPDETLLYVVDTLSGLYKVHLRVPERKHSSQRLVTRLVDFRANNWQQTLPAVQLDTLTPADGPIRSTRLLNVSLRAVDDLAIDFGAGSKGADLIYMSLASQHWPAVAFIYDYFEGRPSGLVVRLDTGTGQLVALEPSQLAHVRTSGRALQPEYDAARRQSDAEQTGANFGIPRLDENDVFDDRPLDFPNGLELTDDKQALLVVDTSNKRILKHYVRGPRRGSSDLWAHTPNYPDNIRRGYDKRYESYWVVGCGQPTDMLAAFRYWSWPALTKLMLKHVYFFGLLVEKLGQHVLMSSNVRDYGYQLKTGSSLCQNGCKSMMILQFNRNGDLIRSIHSSEFPNDLRYFSQVNELIDAQTQEHSLLLSSPSYDYVTKLILPTESSPVARLLE